MPRKFELSWEAHPHYRWVKMYRGVRYRITCADLALPRSAWTKELSYQAANAWWMKKRAEVDGQRAAEHPHAEVLADLARKLDYATRHGLSDETAALAARVELVKTLPADETPSDPATTARVETARLLGADIPPDFDPTAASLLFGQEAVWADRFRRESAVPAERMVGGLADKWAAMKADEARSAVRSADGADNIRIALTHFKAFAGPSSPVDDINADLWHRWYVHCASRRAARKDNPKAGWSVDYAAKVFGVARSFVRWLWECEVLPNLPRNLDNKKYRFKRPKKAIPTFENAEIKCLLDNATGQHKLHLLLMLNCGMTQKDISDLRKSQIDLNASSITRRRSKTEDDENTPEVCYRLWPETLRLLREHLSDDAVYALLTTSKRRWVRKEIRDNGRLKKADNIATLFQHLRRKVKLAGEAKSLKVFRKTSATRLKASKDYRDLRFFFLGHSARTVADRSYAAESQALMNEAVTWLGKQYGLLP